MSHPETPPSNPPIAQAEQEAERYQWTAAAKLYAQALNSVDPSREALRAAQLNERIGYCKFRAAFQAENREQFKEIMKQAKSSRDNASSLYEKENSEALSKRAKARSLFANFWIQDSNDERRVFIQQCLGLAEEAATLLGEQSDTRLLAEAHLDLVEYYSEALFLCPNYQEKIQLLDWLMKMGETAAGEFENLAQDRELVASLSITLTAASWTAEFLMSPQKYMEFGKHAQTLSTKVNEVARHLGTPYELGLAYCAESAVAAGMERDWDKSLAHVKTGISTARQTGDSALIGELEAIGAPAAFWSSWNGEDPERAVEIIQEGMTLASDAVKQLKIQLHRPKINVTLAWNSDCYRALSDYSDDLESKKNYLDKAIEVGKKGVEYSDPKLSEDSMHALAKALYFKSILEPSIDKRVELLKESLTLREKTVQSGLALFPQTWDLGVMYNYLALVKAELSKNEENPQAKLELLQNAVRDMQKCIELCTMWATNPGYMHATSNYCSWYGDILAQLHRLTLDTQDALRAIRAYQDAIALLEKSGHRGEIAPIRWDIAKIYDGVGDYRAASEEFHQAAEDYRHAAEKIHASESTFTEIAAYMDAWSLIEKARISHSEEQYALAAQEYSKSASTLKETRIWNALAEHYEGCSLLEEGESLSRQESEEKAVGSFSQAADHFRAGIRTLEEGLKQAKGEEAEELRNWLKLTETRMKYAKARADLEKARLLDGKGERTSSLTNYRKASEAFKELIPETQNEQARREIETLAYFCDAWAKMKEADTKASADLYTEASDLFEKAEQASEREKSDRLALANAAICRALAAGTRFRRARDPQLYSEIKRELETAADYYQEGGFAKAANWTRATQRLFDALLYLGDAEAEKEARKKAELYHLAEQHLQLAAKIYGEAGFAGKRDEAQRHLERAREEKAILLTPLEVLAENPTASAGAASPVSLLRDQALGAERFESANVVGNMSLRQKDVNVGGDLSLELEIANVGKTPAMLMKLENLAPEGFEIQHDKTPLHVEGGFINMKGKRLEYLKTDEVKIALKAVRKGAYKLRPRILFIDERGSYRSYDFEPTEVTVSELGISGWLRGSGR